MLIPASIQINCPWHFLYTLNCSQGYQRDHLGTSRFSWFIHVPESCILALLAFQLVGLLSLVAICLVLFISGLFIAPNHNNSHLDEHYTIRYEISIIKQPCRNTGRITAALQQVTKPLIPVKSICSLPPCNFICSLLSWYNIHMS